MSKQILGLSFGIGAMLLATQHAYAQSTRNCAERAQVVSRLADGFGETRQSMGIGRNNTVVEVFASDETGSWTITVTLPNGMTCLLVSGQAFEELSEELRPTGLDL